LKRKEIKRKVFLIFNRYLIPVSIIDDTKVGCCEPQFNDRKPKEG
jgi:hypothetical protein